MSWVSQKRESQCLSPSTPPLPFSPGSFYSFYPFLLPTSPSWFPRWRTSSTGSSFSLGRELESRPTRKGVGQQTMSIMEAGRTGMKVCCQEKG